MKLPFGSLWSEFKAFAFKGNMIELAVAVIIGGAFGTVVTSLTQDVIMPMIGYVINTGEKAAATVKDTATQAVTAVAAKTGMASTQPTSQPASMPAATAPSAGATPPTATTAVAAANSAVTDAKAEAHNTGDIASIIKAIDDDRDARDAVAAKAKADADAKAIAEADAKAKAAAPINIDLMVGPVNLGKFIGALLNFLIVAFAVFIMVVKLMGSVMKKMTKPEVPGEPTTRECPECLSIIPIKAKRCSHCTAVIVPPAV
jgi:large-conductance mechanosensitive channel